MLKTIFPAVHLNGSVEAGSGISISGTGKGATAMEADAGQRWM